MAIRDIFKVTRKTFVNPSAWIDYESLRFQNRTIYDALKNIFTTQQPMREESFEQAMKRLGMTEEDVQYGATNYRLFAMVFLIIGLLIMFYSFYLLFQHAAFLGWLLGLSAAALFFAQAFKYDFWSLQMRRRKLGLTFTDWKKAILGDKD